MNVKEIKEMINLMNDNGLVELEIEKDGMRIRLKKTTSAEQASAPIIIEKERVGAVTQRDLQETTIPKAASNTVEIKSPMVGTLYRAPSPESPPYIDAGQIIEPGQVICIIEAMKLMNEIKSEIKGKVVEILVDNAEPVEFGQSIFIIEPL